MILGAPSSADRFDAATTLLDYGFGAYEAAPLPKLEAQPAPDHGQRQRGRQRPAGLLGLPETVLVEKGSGASLHTELTLPEELEARWSRARRWAKPLSIRAKSFWKSTKCVLPPMRRG